MKNIRKINEIQKQLEFVIRALDNNYSIPNVVDDVLKDAYSNILKLKQLEDQKDVK